MRHSQASFLARLLSTRALFAVQETAAQPASQAEAKRYAKEMLAEERKIIAGTLLGPHQPVRRIISGSQVHRWIAE